jgi:hypothetical protein
VLLKIESLAADPSPSIRCKAGKRGLMRPLLPQSHVVLRIIMILAIAGEAHLLVRLVRT